MATIRPLRNYVLVQRATAKKTKGGVLLPDTAQEKPREGVVIKKGEGKRNDRGDLEPIDVEVGDRVLFSPYAGTECKNTQTDEEFLLLSDEEILGVLIGG